MFNKGDKVQLKQDSTYYWQAPGKEGEILGTLAPGIISSYEGGYIVCFSDERIFHYPASALESSKVVIDYRHIPVSKMKELFI